MPFNLVPSVFGLYHHKAAFFFTCQAPKYIPCGIVSLRQKVYRLLCVLVFEICMCRFKFFVCNCECISECFLLSVWVCAGCHCFVPQYFFIWQSVTGASPMLCLNIDLWMCVRKLVFIVLFVNKSQPEGVYTSIDLTAPFISLY